MFRPKQLPNDSQLQRMSDVELAILWKSRPPYVENPDWVRVAKEVRHRDRFRDNAVTKLMMPPWGRSLTRKDS